MIEMCIQGVEKTIFIWWLHHMMFSVIKFKPENGIKYYQNHQYIEKEYTFLNGIFKNRFYFFLYCSVDSLAHQWPAEIEVLLHKRDPGRTNYFLHHGGPCLQFVTHHNCWKHFQQVYHTSVLYVPLLNSGADQRAVESHQTGTKWQLSAHIHGVEIYVLVWSKTMQTPLMKYNTHTKP